MTLIALAGKFGLIQAGILTAVIAGAGLWLTHTNMIGDLGNRPAAQRLEQSVFRTQEQSADAQEATAQVGATLAQMSGGGTAKESVPSGAANPSPPVAAGEPATATPDSGEQADATAATEADAEQPAWAKTTSPTGNGSANPSASETFSSDYPKDTKGYALERAGYELTKDGTPTTTQRKVKALRGEWDERYQRARDESRVLLRDIEKTRDYRNKYFEVQAERIQNLNLSARNGHIIREAMLSTISRQQDAFGKWNEAATEVETRINEIMSELYNVNELMQFLDDGAVFDRIVNASPEVGVNTLLLHQDIQRLETASLEMANTLSLTDAD